MLALAVAGCTVPTTTSGPAATTTTSITTTASTTTTTTTTLAPSTLPPTIAPPSSPLPAPSAATLPNPRLTAGEAFPGVTTAQVCQPGWASAHRDVPEAEWNSVYAAYGIPCGQRRGMEVDHLIPLELGGDKLVGEPLASASRPTRPALLADQRRAREPAA